MTDLRFDADYLTSLRCPVCGAPLNGADEALVCSSQACGTRFPVVDGVPILINEHTSVFRIQDFVERQDTYFNTRTGAIRDLRRFLPGISANIDSEKHYRQFIDLLVELDESPRVLVIGGGIMGQGMDELIAQSRLRLMETDVALGPRTMLVCDAHDLPFVDATFDGVVAQAVLEHVTDPYRCVEEIHRVLRPSGLVYAETPFMQQVHGGRYDFTRFTHLGHRRLFRHFDEIDSGVICGPGMALAWSYRYFLLSFFRSRTALRLVDAFAHFTSFWLKYLDGYLVDKPGAIDAASGYYLLGRRSEKVLSDRELIQLYRGRN